MDGADGNKNQSPKDPTNDLYGKKEAEEEPVIPDANIDLDINHRKPTEQVQAPKEPPEYPITVTVKPTTTTEEKNRSNQISARVRRYARVRTKTKYHTPSMSGNRYT